MEQQTKNVSIIEMTDRLSNMTTEWLADSSHPCNYIRRTGVGTEVARVDRWCGGFQDSHNPVTIGWKVTVGSSSPTGAWIHAHIILYPVGYEPPHCQI